jgi:Heterokaryon incompatibility protein (HET)
MPISHQAIFTLSYVLGSLISIFASGFGDVVGCKVLTWIICRILRVLDDPTSEHPTTAFHVRLVWHASYLLQRGETNQLRRAVGRLIYYDAPSVEGPPGNEIWEVLVYAGMLGLYVTASLACIFYRELWGVFWRVGGGFLVVAAAAVPLIRTNPSHALAALRWASAALRPLGRTLRISIHYAAKGLRHARHAIIAAGWNLFFGVAAGYHHFVLDPGVHRSQPDHRYRPLKEREIRLLRLSRRTPFDVFTCELIHTVLDATPPFEVISYTWGDPDKCHGVVVDGQWMRTTTNAHEVLKDRAPRFGVRLLWLDAVCIDQRNTDEKSVQVALMGELYRRASRVVVWLGDGDADGAYSFLLHLQSNISTYQANDDDLIRELGAGSVDSRWSALIALVEHPYWKRTWISKSAHLVHY